MPMRRPENLKDFPCLLIGVQASSLRSPERPLRLEAWKPRAAEQRKKERGRRGERQPLNTCWKIWDLRNFRTVSRCKIFYWVQKFLKIFFLKFLLKSGPIIDRRVDFF